MFMVEQDTCRKHPGRFGTLSFLQCLVSAWGVSVNLCVISAFEDGSFRNQKPDGQNKVFCISF